MPLWYRFLQALIRFLGITGFGIRVYGRDNVPQEGGVVIASNHQSFLDPVILGTASDRMLKYFARRSLFRNPAFALLIRALGAIEFGRDSVDSAGIRQMIEHLESGEAVVMFPEGTRTRDGSLGKMKPGVGLIAARAGVPVVPAIIQGAFESWPRSRHAPRLWKLRVAFGRPLDPAGMKPRELQCRLERDLQGLFEEMETKRQGVRVL